MANPQAFQKPADAEQINQRASDMMVAIYRFAATRQVDALSVGMLFALTQAIVSMTCKCILAGMTEEQFKREATNVMQMVEEEIG